MNNNYILRTNFLLRSLVGISFLLSTAACGSCKDDDKDDKNKKDEKTPLKFSLTPPAVKDKAAMGNSKDQDLHIGNLTVNVTEGKDDATSYKLNCDSWQVFTDTNYTTIDATANKRALFAYDPKNLKELLGKDVLEKGDTKAIAILFTSQSKKCTSKSGNVKFSIVDKDGKVVAGPVELKWTDA